MENARFLVPVSHVQQFEAYRTQFFTNIYRFVVVNKLQHAQMPRTRDLAISVVTMTAIALPLAHACGVMSRYVCYSSKLSYWMHKIFQLVLLVQTFNSEWPNHYWRLFVWKSIWNVCDTTIQYVKNIWILVYLTGVIHIVCESYEKSNWNSWYALDLISNMFEKCRLLENYLNYSLIIACFSNVWNKACWK